MAERTSSPSSRRRFTHYRAGNALLAAHGIAVCAAALLFASACSAPGQTARMDVELDSLRAENLALELERNQLADSLALIDYFNSGEADRDIRRHQNEVDKLSYDLLSCREGGELIAQLLVDEMFEPASATLTRSGRSLIEGVLGSIMTDDTRHIAVIGHADNTEPGGTLAQRYPTNWELSAARATAVVRYMISDGGIAPKRLSAVSHGDAHPEYSNGTADGRRRNRRIEFLLR